MKTIRPFEITDAALLSTNIVETDYAAYSDVTTYALAARAIITTDGWHYVYESLQAGNVGHAPSQTGDTEWWARVGKTNRWRMFDQSITSVSSNANSIAVSLQTVGRCNALALLNVSAASVNVKVTDAVEGVVYDRTISLVSNAGVADWYSWFFEPLQRDSDVVLMDLPPYTDAVIDITLTDTGGTVSCGCCVVGLQRDIGATLWGMQIGIDDYSVKKRDEWGNLTIVERDYNRTAKIIVLVDKGKVDALDRYLASIRAQPYVWVGSEAYKSTVVYGPFDSFSIDIAGINNHTCSINIKGMT